MQEETQHADALLRRISFWAACPTCAPTPSPRHHGGGDAAKDLAVEYEVRDALQKAWSCASVRDYVSRDLLLAQLRDTEEDHATGWRSSWA